MSKPPGEAATWMSHIADIAVGVRLTDEQRNKIAEAFQHQIDKGLLVGKIATGDHDDDEGNVIFDWSEFGREL